VSEQWRAVVGYEGAYEVSDRGRTRSVDRLVQIGNARPFLKPGRVLIPQPNTNGRLQVMLCHNKKQRLYQVHRLVLAAFVGPCPAGLQSLHWDDNPRNNELSNLRYGTPAENQRDCIRNGRNSRANQTHCVHGHELTGENLYRYGTRRHCKACHKRRDRERRGVAA
jgi:HNH endonuclease/NUMOD4 motif